jgi:hypothetical protein
MSLILMNLKLRFGLHVLNLFSKCTQKKEIPSNYHELQSEEVHKKKFQNFHTYFVGEMDFSNNARNYKIWSKKYKEFRD